MTDPRSPTNPLHVLAPHALAEVGLIVVEAPDVRKAAQLALRETVHHVVGVATVDEGVALLSELPVEILLLSAGRSDAADATACRSIRQVFSGPIVALSARSAAAEMVRLLELGADDRIAMPCSLVELDVRVRHQLLRVQFERRVRHEGMAEVDGLTIDLARQTAVRDGRRIRLTPREWSVLEHLTRGAGRTRTLRQLYDAVWGGERRDFAALVRTIVTGLRRKIERTPAHPRIVLTEPGVGFSLLVVADAPSGPSSSDSWSTSCG